MAVYPSAEEPKVPPYPSGVAGTPGPLRRLLLEPRRQPRDDGTTPVSQPAGSSLPMSPYYFPDVVRNADGSLTGYFDYRPKDADEAITVARSTDNGKSWTTEGEALEQNPGYCPTADTNDDGQGHPYVASIGGSTKLYTLQRPAGDYEGVGLLVHNVEPSAADPLGGAAVQRIGRHRPEHLRHSGSRSARRAERASTSPSRRSAKRARPSTSSPAPTRTTTRPRRRARSSPAKAPAPRRAELTDCTVAGSSPLTVKAKDDLVQVIATANPEALGTKTVLPGATYTVPKGPNKPSGEGGLAEIRILNGNPAVSPFTTFILNENAPNRLYIDGVTVYCAQSNANPTTKIENCTTDSGSPLTVHQGDAITADPIVPPNATVTTGLKAPDGIVGTLPTYPGAPAGSTVVLYTEKELAYFIVGTTDGSVSGTNIQSRDRHAAAAAGTSITYTPSVHPSEPLPRAARSKSISAPPVEASRSRKSPARASRRLPRPACRPAATTSPAAPAARAKSPKATGSAARTPRSCPSPRSPRSARARTRKSKGPEKLFNNNEDLTVLRAAYTFNGVNFTRPRPDQRHDAREPATTRAPTTTSPTPSRRRARRQRARPTSRPAKPTRPSFASSARAARSSPTRTAATGCSCPGRGRPTATATRSTRSSTPNRPTARNGRRRRSC